VSSRIELLAFSNIHALFPIRDIIKTWFLFLIIMKPWMFEIKVVSLPIPGLISGTGSFEM
jgi:hypothetical protein